MAILILCRGCQSKVRIADDLVDKVIKCPQCGRKMIFHKNHSEANGSPATPAPPIQAADKTKPKVAAKPRSGPAGIEPAETHASALKAKKSPAAVQEGKPAPKIAPPPEPAPALDELPADEPVPVRRPQPAQASEADEEEEGGLPPWLSLWGLIAFAFGVLALIMATVLALWTLTLTFASLGLVAVVLGIPFTWSKRRTRDRAWLALSALLSGAVLSLALYEPTLLNSFWAIDVPVPQADVDKQILVPREQSLAVGRPLAADEWADAAKEAIRQDLLIIRVESAQAGPLPNKDAASYLLIHFRFANAGRDIPIKFDGFSPAGPKPTLTDGTGRSFAFLEQRPRKEGVRGAAVFEVRTTQTAAVLPASRLDHLLVFELPPDGWETLKLEVPASAWGRKGTCKFRIPGAFASLP